MTELRTCAAPSRLAKGRSRDSIPRFLVSRRAAIAFLCLGVAWLTSSAAPRLQAPQNKPDPVRDAPPQKPEPRDFAGTWKASFEGKTFTVVTLKIVDGKLAGTLASGEVDLSEDGEVSHVNQEAGEPRSIFDAQLTGQILSFKEKDGEDVNSLEMKLTGANAAELKYILPDPLPEGMPMPKPFRMTRAEKPPAISGIVADRTRT
ncbi:MAG TPA: hypothetical protein VEU31_07645 [Candidatus Acidoferrales bacterium]|nr:hypothetical protein [Candidatus Acidoferrales bacterium]